MESEPETERRRGRRDSGRGSATPGGDSTVENSRSTAQLTAIRASMVVAEGEDRAAGFPAMAAASARSGGLARDNGTGDGGPTRSHNSGQTHRGLLRLLKEER